jgi:hypothetical protein
MELADAIKVMAKALYEREYVEKKEPIYDFDEMRRIMEESEPALKHFFTQLYLAARPSDRNTQTMDRMKKLMIFICYLLASLNNTKINAFKFQIAYYLDSAGTSNEGLNTMANIGITTTARSVDRRKKQMSDVHTKYVEDALQPYEQTAFILNVDDYHNIHTQRQPDTTSTSWATHMATILAIPCPIPAIPCNGIINPKIMDSALIIKHLDRRFITRLGVCYYDCFQRKERSDEELMNQLTLHSYNDRLMEKRSDRHIKNSILIDFVESNLKGITGYTSALKIVYDQEPMAMYLSNYAIPVVADWPGQFFIRKAVVQQFILQNRSIPRFVKSFLPVMGPLHVSLNARELVFLKNSFLFNDIYKGIFGKHKDMGKKPRPWRIDLILYIVNMAWAYIADDIFLKFGRTCKNIEFLYPTDLLSNLIPLVLDVYAVHHREGNWLAYEEACMRCWSDLFLRFDRRNYKRAPLMFFSDIFYWMETGHPIFNMFTNNLASISDCPVEIAHSIIRRRTAKFFTAQQLQKEAHFIFQQRHNNAFQQHFVNSIKYPYAPKQLHMLSKKCAVWLLEAFGKIYRTRNEHPLITETSSDCINTYQLPSLGYKITDRHLPRGFVTRRKPDTSITMLCDFELCDQPNNLCDGKILACGHGYHNHCLQQCQNKCVICLEYLQEEIKKNVDAVITSMMKESADISIDATNDNTAEDDLNNVDEAIDDILMAEILLEHAKNSFLGL